MLTHIIGIIPVIIEKSANPNVVPMDSITLSDSQNILICSNKCDQYNDVRDKYCLSLHMV